MTRTIRGTLMVALACLIVFAGRPAAAQDMTVGYQFQSLGNGEWTSMPMGIGIDASAPISRSLSAVGQFDWSRKTEQDSFLTSSYDVSTKLATFGAGLRWTANGGGTAARPFVQLLVGTTTLSVACHLDGISCSTLLDGVSLSDTKGMVSGGGGVTFPLSRKLRGVVQADYRHIFSTDGTNSIRVLAGVRVAFK